MLPIIVWFACLAALAVADKHNKVGCFTCALALIAAALMVSLVI